ncbi:pentatricopeptide repeat-containing protein At1g51965, mitochondrial isoform X2 [Aristolochia californica]|uniref:pentatricopeptide repeat-containing protein At1g51965, mitochondrial isoform X2 n=1 Tax=Aristolochia californica TaxID=171875 RepID=UPI0035DF9DDE
MIGRLDLLLPRVLARSFATSYTARVVRADKDGRSFAIEVDTPSTLHDTRGYALPRRDLICRVSRIIQTQSSTSDPLLELSDYLQTLTLTFTTYEVSEILKSLRSPHKALLFFEFASTSIPGYRHDCFTYNRILTILATFGHCRDLVLRVVDDMERTGVLGNISTINILIGIFGGGQELERCLSLVRKWGLRFNSYTYKCLLQVYLRSYQVENAFGVYEEIRRRGYKLDIIAYNMLLDALAKNGKVERAYKVFADMKRR